MTDACLRAATQREYLCFRSTVRFLVGVAALVRWSLFVAYNCAVNYVDRWAWSWLQPCNA